MQLDEAEAELRMVGQVALVAQRAVAPGMVDTAVAHHRVEQETGEPAGRLDQVVAGQQPAGLGEGTQRHAVPVGQHLVVGDGPDTPGSRRVEPLAHRAFQRLGHIVGVAPLEHVVAMFPVAGLGGAVEAHRRRRIAAQHTVHLAGGPDMELAFDTLGIGVLRRCEGRRGRGRVHLAQEVPEDVLGDEAQPLVAGQTEGAGIDPRELRVVVQHLLEVRHMPALVRRVAGETAADMVVDAARGHVLQGRDQQGAGLFVATRGQGQQVLQQRRLRELGRVAETAVARVEAARQLIDGAAMHIVGRRTRRGCGVAAQVLDERLRLLLEVAAPLQPRLAHGGQHLGKARHARARPRREVGAAEERRALRREEHVHRPAAMAAQGLQRAHVDMIDIGQLLAVDLDRDEALGELPRDGLVLEALALHHVAPVASGVADRQEDGLVLGTRFREGLFAPGKPVDRIVGVLEQVGAGFAGEAVGGHGKRSDDATTCIIALSLS